MVGNELTVLISVRGLVQQVGYRYFITKYAEPKKFKGYIKNKADLSVEIGVTLPEDELEAFLSYCKKGPVFAQVSSITYEKLDTPFLKPFQINVS